MDLILINADMSTLTRLPSEVLSKVLALLSGTSLVYLWRTGSKHLLTNMSERSGVTEATFYLAGALNPSRLPRMLGSFKALSSLTIIAPGLRIGHPWRIWHSLSKLNLLRTLYLSFVEAEEWMFDGPSKELTISDNTEAARDFRLRFLELRPIASTFPHLQSLRLATGAQFFTDKDLAKLPQSLTYLNLSNHHRLTSACYEYLAALPHITTILLQIFRQAPLDESAKLPKTITSIAVTSVLLTIPEIPRSFWNGCNIIHLHLGMTPSSIEHVPSDFLESITSMIETDPKSSFSRFSRLKSIHLMVGGSAEGRSLPELPSTLEKLKITLTEFRSAEAFNLPPFISDLQLDIQGAFDPALLITALNQEAKHLKSLSVHFLPLTDPYNVLGPLTTPVTSLVWFCKRFNWSDIGTLPRSLTALETNLSLSYMNLSLLPASLTTIRAALRFDVQDSRHILPKGLTDVKLQFLSRPLLWPWDFPHGLVNHLNTCSLESLSILDNFTLCWDLTSIKALPTSLRSLSLTMMSWPTGSVKLLPRGLSYLKLHQTFRDPSTKDFILRLCR